MKNLFLFAALIVFVFCGCSKSTKSVIAPEITFSATIDGVQETFTSKDTAQNPNPKGLYISGTNATTSDKMILVLGSPDDITTGTYSTHGANTSGLQILLGVGPGYTFDNYYFTYDIHNGPTYEGIITISSISKTNIQGTFSGSLVLESSVGAEIDTRPSKTITNGKFNLVLHQ